MSTTPEAKDLRFLTLEAMKWTAWMHRMQSDALSLPADALVGIKYEDVLIQPERELGKVCERLGVDWDQQMLAPESRANDPVMSRDNMVIHQKLTGPLDQSRVAAYESLPAWAIDVIEHHTKPVLTSHGYQLIQPRVHLKDRLKKTLVGSVREKRWRSKVSEYVQSRTFPTP
jgi:hypothetical protein